MELLFGDRYYGTEEWVEGRFLIEIVNNLKEMDPDVYAIETDIGHGADFPSVLIQLFSTIDISSVLTTGGIGAIVLGGEKINKSIDGWLEVGIKLKNIFNKITPSRIDENAALLLVLNDIFSKSYIITIDQLSNISTQVIELTPVSWGKGVLDKRPDCLYIITIKLIDRIFVYGIRSSSSIDFIKEYSSEWIDFYNTPNDLARLPSKNTGRQ
jgi:hypothetical protein